MAQQQLEAERDVIQRIATQLEPQFSGVFSAETVERSVAESYATLARGASITEFIPLFLERVASDRLKAAAESEWPAPSDVPQVLFVCVHNAGRSQMAAALLTRLAAGAARARSAGTAPAGRINPAVVEALDEWGIDISSELPRALTDEDVEAADVIVGMGCGDACPVLPGKRYLEWHLEDPAGRSLDDVRRIRDEIRLMVEDLLDELVPVAA